MNDHQVSSLNAFVDTHQEEAIEFLRHLIGFDSTFVNQGVLGHELGIQQWLEERLCEWGFETCLFEPDNEKIKGYADFNPGHDYRGRPNLVARWRGGGAGRSLILNGHVDTVPLGERKLWLHEPLGGEIADGKLYGRGAADMKAGLAAMILAVRYLCQAGFELRGDVLIQSVVDEEGGGNGTLACVAEGYTADGAIVTEPSGLRIFPASRGVFLLRIDVEGRASHAALKWNGVNAIEKAMRIVQGLAELEHRWLALRKNPLLPSPTITIGQIEGGIGGAVVPDQCSMRFDVKYLPVEVDRDGVEQHIVGSMVQEEVEAWIRRICSGDEWLSAHPPKLSWYLHVLPHYTDPNHPLVDCLRGASNIVTGQNVVSGMPSGADARILQGAGSIPTVIFGPGYLEQAHTIDEFVSIEQYLQAIKVLALATEAWTSGEDGCLA